MHNHTKQLLIQLTKMLEDENHAYMICILDKDSEEESFSGVNVESERQAIKILGTFKEFIEEAGSKKKDRLN